MPGMRNRETETRDELFVTPQCLIDGKSESQDEKFGRKCLSNFPFHSKFSWEIEIPHFTGLIKALKNC